MGVRSGGGGECRTYPIQKLQANLDRDAEQRPVFLGEAFGNKAADAQAAGEGHEGVKSCKEVGDLERRPVEPKVEVVVAGSEDVERDDKQEVAKRDL